MTISFDLELTGNNPFEDLQAIHEKSFEIQKEMNLFYKENNSFVKEENQFKSSMLVYEEFLLIQAYIGLSLNSNNPDYFIELVQFVHKKMEDFINGGDLKELLNEIRKNKENKEG